MPLTPEQKAYQVEYRKAHREKLLAYNREYHRRWYQENRARRLAQIAKYHSEHPEMGRTSSRNWARRNAERHRANTRRWRAAHSERRKRWQKEYRQQNRLKISQKVKEYAKNNPHVRRAIAAKRRALRRQVLIDPRGIKSWMKEIRSKPFARCHWCGTKVSGRKIHFDHIVPISKGGAHSIGNLCASCRDCNLSKNNRLLADWICGGQSFLSL